MARRSPTACLGESERSDVATAQGRPARRSLASVLRGIDELADDPGGDLESAAPDRRDGRVYRISDNARMALKLAIVTRRPLLLRGDPGSGKSSLGAYVARNLG